MAFTHSQISELHSALMHNTIFTIGFTQKTAEQFFGMLKTNSVQRLVDTRLNNINQLAGFSKRDDLKYFCHEIIGIEYFHWEETAPTSDLLAAYKKKLISWDEYAKEYAELLHKRRIASQVEYYLGSGGACLLCSEAKPHHCHRSILATYSSTILERPVRIQHLT